MFNDISDQVRRLDREKAPDFAFLMVGGNPGGFFSIIENCVYQQDRDKDYGPEYPDPEGECYKALRRARQNIRSPWFINGIWNSVYAILDEPRIRKNRRFRLVVVSYAGLFNHDDKRCDDWSFGIWSGKQPKLTTKLRRDINGVIDDGRSMYDRLINYIMFNPKVRFIDVNSALDGHRFCENTTEGSFESQNANSWLWNLEWPGCLPLVPHSDSRPDKFTVQWGLCRKCGAIGQLGELQRPFHPKAEGFAAIEVLLKKELQEEFAGIYPGIGMAN
ncbi:hypothetical protein EJ08DRAFT_2596 [Tothia fuscella]|uniref:Uncharacterized protein n=1 Tax=Tothia fuscella TaxID=1048955 RepID=A0A9P4P1Z9_9PEZI|nr:hypothetical protein EJ08DRAFT_2596 [Tothia fuscella]